MHQETFSFQIIQESDMKATLLLTLCCFALGSSTESNKRIVGDNYAPIGEFPYVVSLQLDGRHFCGGSLITRKHVLTAAHCVADLLATRVSVSRIKVAVGTNVIPGGTIYNVDRVAHHPSFTMSSLRGDVAVIRLTLEVTLSANVRLIELPKPGQILYDSTPLDVAGFGTDHISGPASTILKQLTTYSMSQMDCRKYWPDYYLDGRFCALLSAGEGVCQGDSGGPVTVNKRVVVGVVTATSGRGCGKGIPDLFTYVPTYLDFIYSEIGMN